MDHYNDMRGMDGFPAIDYGMPSVNPTTGQELPGQTSPPYAAYPKMEANFLGAAEMPDMTQSGMQQMPDMTQSGMQQMPDMTQNGMQQMPDMTQSGMQQMPDMTQSGMQQMPGMAQSGMQQMPGMTQSGMQQMPADPAMDMDPPSGQMSPEMQQFMEQGYLMGPNCFGRDSQRYANQLMEYINDEYRDSLTYQNLARRAPNANARRIFRNMSSDEMRHARRWAAAYFLITGARYFPTRATIGPVNVPADYSQALRERYLGESRDAIKYRQFADSTSDRCLKRMATDTSDDERQHAQQILRLIQSM